MMLCRPRSGSRTPKCVDVFCLKPEIHKENDLVYAAQRPIWLINNSKKTICYFQSSRCCSNCAESFWLRIEFWFARRRRSYRIQANSAKQILQNVLWLESWISRPGNASGQHESLERTQTHKNYTDALQKETRQEEWIERRFREII